MEIRVKTFKTVLSKKATWRLEEKYAVCVFIYVVNFVNLNINISCILIAP